MTSDGIEGRTPPPGTLEAYRRAVETYRQAVRDGRVRLPLAGRPDLSAEAVAARRAWWTAGGPGHWPGCPCGKHPGLLDDRKESSS